MNGKSFAHMIIIIIIMDISVAQDLGHNVPYKKLQKNV